MKRTGSCSSCSRQACCSSSTTRGGLRRSRGSEVDAWIERPVRACSDVIGGYRRPMDSGPALDHAPTALVFDLDGTLVDTVETRIRAWLGVFEEFGYPGQSWSWWRR